MDRSSTAPSAPPRLETPSLQFGRIPDGCSVTRPIVVTDPSGRAVEVDVVVPPLAPFSIAGTTERAEPADEPGRARIWVRYDATRPMARDRGEMLVASPATGHRWRVELSGSEARATR